MLRSLLASVRFARHWSAPGGDPARSEVRVLPEDGGEPVPATLVEGAGSPPLRGWVVLHGLTRPGRRHPEMVRFVRALASTGSRVLVPEIPPWRELSFEPAKAQAILRGAVRWLAESPSTLPGGVNLMGFSFGGPQAMLAAADPEMASRIRGVASWGGYADLERTVSFQFTGEHEWEGRRLKLRPDPYGRWVVGANCLPLVEGYEDRQELARALRRLAAEAGDRRIMALDPALDPLKEEIRLSLPSRDRPLFTLFAPPQDRDPDPEAGREMAREMVAAARRRMPLLDPIPSVAGVEPSVRLLHGRSDRLIPFTETLRLARTLEPRARDIKSGVTGLFAHSGGAGPAPLPTRAWEGLQFLRVLRQVLELG